MPVMITRKNSVLIAVTLYIIIYSAIMFIKPSFFFNTDGSLRQFGVGYCNKTIFPVWLFALMLGILSYLFVTVWMNN